MEISFLRHSRLLFAFTNANNKAIYNSPKCVATTKYAIIVQTQRDTQNHYGENSKPYRKINSICLHIWQCKYYPMCHYVRVCSTLYVVHVSVVGCRFVIFTHLMRPLTDLISMLSHANKT